MKVEIIHTERWDGDDVVQMMRAGGVEKRDVEVGVAGGKDD